MLAKQGSPDEMYNSSVTIVLSIPTRLQVKFPAINGVGFKIGVAPNRYY
jgi:hypothetical protein